MANVSEERSRQVAEESREATWEQPSFMREMFLGNFRLDLIHPYPELELQRPEFVAFYRKFEDFLRDDVDPVEIDETGEYPQSVIDGLTRLGAFGLKIPREYGGLGFDQVEYAQIMELVGSYDGNVMALLSAHQSIGVPQPVKLFGTEELQKKYLPMCARGDISAFALTEPDVGSDPARLSTTAVLEGDFYVLNGRKLWCTNGTLAKLLVVMAMHPDSEKISAFVVETEWDGVEVERRCRKLARQSFHGMIVYRAKLERKQAFLFRLVDIINELFAMSASVCRAHAIACRGGDEGKSAVALADGFCRASSRRVDELFRSLWHNDDQSSYVMALDVLNGEHVWMESLLDRLDQPASTPAATSTAAEPARMEESAVTT